MFFKKDILNIKMLRCDKDILFNIAIKLNIYDLISFLNSNKQIYNKINRDVWIYLLKNDFCEYPENINCKNTTYFYGLLYILNKIRDMVKNSSHRYDTLYDLHLCHYFSLHGNGIEEIPKEIGRLYNLIVLNLDCNKIEKIPKEIGHLHNLRILNLNNNKIRKLPKEISGLQNLEELYLHNNCIKKLSKEICALSKLKILSLSNNGIKEIPKEIENLKKLHHLYLENTEIPKEILQNLQNLGFSYELNVYINYNN